MYSQKLELYNIYNDIFDNQISRYMQVMQDNNKIPKETHIFLQSAKNSINNCLNLLDNYEFIDSLCLLRSSFEAIMFSLAINFDKKIYKAYKCYNGTYNEFLKNKYKKEKQKNHKAQTPDIDKKHRNFLQPNYIRRIVAKNYRLVFNDLFFDCKSEKEVEDDLNSFYKYLCAFTHPSIVKAYAFKIQNDETSLNNIKTIFRLNINYCKMLLILALNYFSENNNMDDICNLYALVFLLDINLIDDVNNLNSILKKYDEYLYLDVSQNYFNNKKLPAVKKEVNELNNNANFGEKAFEIIRDISIKFDALELFEDYLKTNFTCSDL